VCLFLLCCLHMYVYIVFEGAVLFSGGRSYSHNHFKTDSSQKRSGLVCRELSVICDETSGIITFGPSGCSAG